MDWHDQLKNFALQNPDLPQGPEPETEPETAETEPQHIDIFLERKGRAGKTATLITGWTLSDQQLAQVAAQLKQRLATGGSARGGDILLQGDRRQQALQILKQLGHKPRII